MESQGSESAVGRFDLCNALQSGRRCVCRFDVLVRAAIFCMISWSGVAQAQTTYVHDANGRVVAVTQSNGTTQQYAYDAVGHPSQVSSAIPSGQLALFAFSPTHGLIGTDVTLQGQGFSSNAANDSVSFNGASATVISASSSQLLVSIPSGATNGPISVTVGGQTIASAQPFVIDNGFAPIITQVTPVVAPGGSVTVTGANLAPFAADTTVQLAGTSVTTMLPSTDTQLQFAAPTNATSGHVTVQTPYGTATSATPVAVLPSSVASQAANAQATYLTINSSPTAFSTNVPGQVGVLSFDATQGENLELTLNSIAIAGTSSTEIGVNVYGPTGSVVRSYDCYSTSPGASCRIPLWNLPAGSYAAVVSPQYAGNTLSFNAILQADVIGPALTPNAPTTVNLAAGEVERLTFTASAGDTIALQLAGVNTTPSGQAMYVQIFAPGTIPIATATGTNYYTIFDSTSTNTINLANLPSTGTYIAVVSIVPGTPGSAQLTLAPDITATAPDNGASQAFQTSEGGQNVYLTFTANPGDNLELTINGIQITGQSSTEIGVNVFDANGTNIASEGCYTTNPGASCRLPLWSLAGGTYSVVINPQYSTNTISFNAILEPDAIGPALTAATPVSVNLAAGEVERFTFNANAGDTVALQLAGVSTAPAGQYMYIQVYAPGVTPTAGNTLITFATTGSTTANLPNLPATGTYTAIASIIPGTPGTSQLTLAAGVSGALPDNGNAQSYQTNVGGQNVYLTFSANQGDNLELTFDNIAIAGSGASEVGVNIYNSAGTDISSYVCYTTNPGASCRIPLWGLAAGTYTVVAAPVDAQSVISFNAMLEPDTIGQALTPNTPTAVNLAAGEVERLTFTANAGDDVALELSGVATTPAGQNMYVQVYAPGVTPTAGNTLTTFATNGSTTANLQNLPATGTYTAIVSIIPGTPGNAQLTLWSGATGAVTDNDSSQNFQASGPGQNVYLSFTANAGDNLEFTLGNISVSGGNGNGAQVVVYGPTGSEIASNSCSGTSTSVPDCRTKLWNLTAGTYSIIVSPTSVGVIAFNALLQPDTIGSALVANTPTTVNLAAGQVERLTFNGTAGGTVTLALSGVSTTPSGQGVYVNIYRPDVGTITPYNTYSAMAGTSTGSVTLSNLPVTGAYTLTVETIPGIPATAQLTLESP